MDPNDPNNAGLKAKDPGGGKAGKQPGKVSNTDNYGNGGAGGQPAVPGKSSGTEHLPDGPNGKQSKAADNKAAGKHNSPPKLGPVHMPPAKELPTKPQVGKKTAAGAAKPTGLAQSPKKSTETNHTLGAPPPRAPTHAPSAPLQVVRSEPAQVIDIPTIAPPQPVLVAPPVAKGKSDPANEALRTEVTALSGQIKSCHDEILALSKQLQQSITSQLQGYASTIDQRVQTGTKRVGTAYDSVSKAITDSTAHANEEIAKREKAIPATIKAARDAKGAEIKANVEKVKADTHKLVTAGDKVQVAKKQNLAFADQLDAKTDGLIQHINDMTALGGPIAGKLDPKKYSNEVQQGGAGARAVGLQALVEDKRLSLITTAGKNAVKFVQKTIKTFSDQHRKDSDKAIDVALRGPDEDLDHAVKQHEPEQQKHLDAAAAVATQALQKQVASARTGIASAEKQATAKIAADRRVAEDGAHKAGTALSDNIQQGAKEIEGRLARKAAQDATSYNKVSQQLQQIGKSRKLDPASKAKLDAMKASLTAAHEENKKTLQDLATTSVAEMKSGKEQQYEKAITDYETAAQTTKTDLIGKMTTGTTQLGQSFDTIGTSFDSTVASETKKLDVELDFYKKEAETVPGTYGTTLDKLLSTTVTGIQAGADKMLELSTVQEKLNKDSEPAIQAAIKTGPEDAQGLWDAMDGIGTDENKIFGILRKATPGEVVWIEGCYNDAYPTRGTKDYRSPLRADLDDELSGTEWDIAFAYLKHDRERALKLELDDSRGFFNDEEDRMEQVLRSASDDEIKNIVSSPDGKAVLGRVKDCLSGCDLDVVNALTATDDKGVPLADRKIQADSIRIYDAMYGGITGIGTDEAKIKEILERTTDPEERKKLHAYYNAYIQKNDPLQAQLLKEQSAGQDIDLMDASFNDEMSGGELTYTRALSETQLSDEDHKKLVQMAKLVDGAQGGGTDEDKMYDALDDEEYAKKYQAAKDDPKEQDRLAKEHEAALNARLRWLEGSRVGEDGKPMHANKIKNEDGTETEGAELKSGANIQASGIGGSFQGDSIADILKGEMGTENVTFQEMLRNKWSDEKKGSFDKAHWQRMAVNGDLNLEWMVAQRKMQAGFAEPELMIAYACWGVTGTDEDTLKKALKEKGEIRTKKGIEDLRAAFFAAWGVDMYDGVNELDRKDFKEPTGQVPSEVSGKDWLEIRISLMGRPTTPEEIGYVDNVRYKFVTTGTGTTSHWSHAREDMDVNHQRIQDAVAKAKLDNQSLKSFDPAGKDTKPEDRDYKSQESTDGKYLEGNRLEILAGYAEKSEMAFLEAKEAMANAIITVVELIGAALITAASMGASSPMLVMFIGNLILSGLTIMMRKDMVGDAYGSEDIGIDVVKGIVMAAIAAAGEAKSVANFAGAAGRIGGKTFEVFAGGAEKAGMKVVGGESLAFAEKATAKLTGEIATATKQVAAKETEKVGLNAGAHETENVLTKEAAEVGQSEVKQAAGKGVAKEGTDVGEKGLAKEGTQAAEKGGAKQAAEKTAGKEGAGAAAKKTAKERVEDLVTAGTKNAMNAVMSDSADFLMDEKTYDMKFWEALFGEHGLGARLLKKIPSAFAQGAMQDYIQGLAGAKGPEYLPHTRSGSEAVFRAMLAEVGGNTAGFLTYVDNYQDASTFWIELLKSNVRSVASGGFNGIAGHAMRAKGLAHELVEGHKKNEPGEALAKLHEAAGYMKPEEMRNLANYVAQMDPTAVDLLPEPFKKLVNKQETAGGSVTGPGGETPKAPAEEKKQPAADDKRASTSEEKKPQLAEDKKVADEKKVAAAEEKKSEVHGEEQKKPAPVNETKPVEDPKETEEKSAGKHKTEEKAGQEHDKPTVKSADDDKHAPSQQQLDQGHAGVEVHSHFIGNVPDENIKAVVGKSAGKVPNQVSEWEPLLREITKLKHNDEIAHKRGADGKIKTRGAGGDAVEQAQQAVKDIAELKRDIKRAEKGQGKYKGMEADERQTKIRDLQEQIETKARTSVEAALKATDETDFNSSYAIRDELIKKHYGGEDREAVLGTKSGDLTGEALGDAETLARLREHFKGRETVLDRIKQAEEIQSRSKKGLSDKDKTDLASLKKSIEDQFAYDQYAKQTISRLADDNIKYTEQSNSGKKLDERFDKDQLAVLKKQLIEEQRKIIETSPDPAAREAAQKKMQQLENLQIAHLAMVNTSFFGTRDQLGNEGEFQNFDRESEQGQKAWNKELDRVVKQAGSRDDTAGVDIAGMEHFRFDDIGKDRMEQLVRRLAEVATPEHPIVLRPHVGEGAVDTVAGEAANTNHDRYKASSGKELSHYDRGRSNVDRMLEVFQKIADENGGRLPPNLIVRFGHVTHASPDAVVKMAKLGIIAEVNLTSNVKTGSVNQNPEELPKPGKGQPKPELPERLEDHSLPTMIFAGAPVILSTDSHEVMGTDLPTEYAKAKNQIDKVRNNEQAIRVTVEQAQARGWEIHEGPPPHGTVHYYQLDGEEKKRFDDAYDKLYRDANKYYDNRPKQHDGRTIDPGDDGSQTPKVSPPGSIVEPAVPPDTAKTIKQKSQVEEQSDHLRKLKRDLASSDDAVKTRAREELDRLHADPDWQAALKVNDIFDIGVKHKENNGTEEERKADSEALSKNLPEVMAEIEKKKAGADPVLQQKRDHFERAVAMEILHNRKVRAQIDNELKRLCDIAYDYITKTRTSEAEQAKTLSDMHTDASKGYGGGLRSKEMQDQVARGDFSASKAKMLEVLKEGNIRERMLALQEFANIIGKDALSADGRAKILAAGETSGDTHKYSADDAKKLVERAIKFQEVTLAKDQKPANLFKPTMEESAGGKHAEYAGAKASRDEAGHEMDTKLPPMLQEKINEYLGKSIAANPGQLSGAGENNPLARTTITVREAIRQGLQLSSREIDAAGGLDAELNWVVGSKANIVNDNIPFIQNAKQDSMPLKAGISGTTYRWMQISDMLGGDPRLARLAAIASLQAADAHSFHEIAVAARGFGVDYNSSQPYANMGSIPGLEPTDLERIAKSVGSSMDELNGKKPGATPVP